MPDRDLEKETADMRAGLESIHHARAFSGKPLPKPRKGAFTTKAMKQAHSPKIPAHSFGSNVPKKKTADVLNAVGASTRRNTQLSQIDKDIDKQR